MNETIDTQFLDDKNEKIAYEIVTDVDWAFWQIHAGCSGDFYKKQKKTIDEAHLRIRKELVPRFLKKLDEFRKRAEPIGEKNGLRKLCTNRYNQFPLSLNPVINYRKNRIHGYCIKRRDYFPPITFYLGPDHGGHINIPLTDNSLEDRAAYWTAYAAAKSTELIRKAKRLGYDKKRRFNKEEKKEIKQDLEFGDEICDIRTYTLFSDLFDRVEDHFPKKRKLFFKEKIVLAEELYGTSFIPSEYVSYAPKGMPFNAVSENTHLMIDLDKRFGKKEELNKFTYKLSRERKK